MKAEPLSIGKIVSERQRFVVPIYQRTYSWTVKEQLEPFFDQVESKAEERLRSDGVSFSHYMGALLLIPDGEAVFGRIHSFNIVDGQQRLTTFHLLFAALRDVAIEYQLDDLARRLADLILHNEQVPMQDPRKEKYKLQPSAYDVQLFRHLVDLRWNEIRDTYPEHFYKNGNLKNGSPAPLAAYWFFWEKVKDFILEPEGIESHQEHGHTKRLEALTNALFQDFKLIVITLSKEDDAQVIFETLNSGGKPLAAMDLVRNDVFHRAIRRKEDEVSLMEDHWSVFETPFWKQEQTQGRIKKPRIDFFLANVLSAERGKVIQLSELYAEYKDYVSKSSFTNAKEELRTLTQHIPTYTALVEPPSAGILARLSKRLQVFDVSTAYPLVFVIAKAACDDSVKAALYDQVASYVIRRAFCGLTPKNYNRVFIELAAYLKEKGASLDVWARAFSEKKFQSEATRFPTDSELRKAIKEKSQYFSIPSYRLKMLFEELEFASRDKFNVHGTLQDGLTIEHIMPQEWRENWPLPMAEIPPDSKIHVEELMLQKGNERERRIHTLGNLTLLTPPANSSAGHAAFADKKPRLIDSLLKLNSDIASLEDWNESEIDKRAEQLCDVAIGLWPAPQAVSAAEGAAI